MDNATSALNFPEILLAVLQQIDASPTLASCARIGTFWHSLVIPVLWVGGVSNYHRKIRSRSKLWRSPPLHAHKVLTEGPLRFHHYIKHVRSLELSLDFEVH